MWGIYLKVIGAPSWPDHSVSFLEKNVFCVQDSLVAHNHRIVWWTKIPYHLLRIIGSVEDSNKTRNKPWSNTRVWSGVTFRDSVWGPTWLSRCFTPKENWFFFLLLFIFLCGGNLDLSCTYFLEDTVSLVFGDFFCCRGYFWKRTFGIPRKRGRYEKKTQAYLLPSDSDCIGYCSRSYSLADCVGYCSRVQSDYNTTRLQYPIQSGYNTKYKPNTINNALDRVGDFLSGSFFIRLKKIEGKPMMGEYCFRPTLFSPLFSLLSFFLGWWNPNSLITVLKSGWCKPNLSLRTQKTVPDWFPLTWVWLYHSEV